MVVVRFITGSVLLQGFPLGQCGSSKKSCVYVILGIFDCNLNWMSHRIAHLTIQFKLQTKMSRITV